MVKIICAMDKHRGIGIRGKMPWHFPEDLKHFREMTTGHTVLMGRKTFESIGKALPDRTCIILTHQKDYSQPDCIVVHSLSEALEIDSDVFVIGGENLFEQTIAMADELLLTEIQHEFPADRFFPEFDASQYKRTVIKTVNEPYHAEFCRYTKR